MNKQSFYYKNKKHIKVCRKKTAEENVRAHSSNIVTRVKLEDFDLLAIYRLNYKLAPPVKVNIEENRFVFPMEVNTGASTSLLNWDTFQKINISSQFILSPTKCKLETYSGKIALPKGVVVEVEFSYKRKNVGSKFLITSEKYRNVLGRDGLGMLCLNWSKLFGLLNG